MDDTLFEETGMEELEDEDELGLDEFDDGYGDDELMIMIMKMDRRIDRLCAS